MIPSRSTHAVIDERDSDATRRCPLRGVSWNSSVRVGWWSGIFVSCTDGSWNGPRAQFTRLWIL